MGQGDLPTKEFKISQSRETMKSRLNPGSRQQNGRPSLREPRIGPLVHLRPTAGESAL